MSILKDWYNGTIYPPEDINPKSAEDLELTGKIEQAQDYFLTQFSPADKVRFDELIGLTLEQSGLYAYANFTYGFKLGLLLMHEVMTGENGPGV